MKVMEMGMDGQLRLDASMLAPALGQVTQ